MLGGANIIRAVWKPVTWCGTAIGILYLWPDIRDLPQTYGLTWGFPVWFDREAVSYFMLVIALAWIVWIDTRPLVMRWLQGRKFHPISVLQADYSSDKVTVVFSEGADESRKLKEIAHFVSVRNDAKDGRTLRNVQVWLNAFGRSGRLPAESEALSRKINLQHGVVEKFEVGRTIWTELSRGGTDQRTIPAVEFNSLFRDALVARFTVSGSGETISFGYAEDDDVWELPLMITADDVPQLPVVIAIDLGTRWSVLRVESVNQVPVRDSGTPPQLSTARRTQP